jgi:puromycin-sensitive aminopeptidase
MVVPTRYELHLEPDLGASLFGGHETIHLTVREPVAEIVLNAVELRIDEAHCTDQAGRCVPAAIRLEAATERCWLTLPAPLAVGSWRLRLIFRGTLNDRLHGFYRSTYKNSEGQTRVLAATQFEATDARRAFPCWDEPAFKAVFSCSLAIDPALTAVSNTPIVAEKIENGRRFLQFADTMPMSTYLVAFVVGELEATEPTYVGKTALRVWSVPGRKHLAQFGQEIGAASLRFFEDYYQRPYPGDKLDLLAIPDFAAGAMENFGAITFRETALLVDHTTATHAELERVADVVSHENAHMWFGDLVTMSWWNGLWLNEAFATFMEMLAVDAWKPHWQRWTSFGASRASALQVDGLSASRPIEFPVSAPRDAEAMFDVLTYEKGASVLRMLEQHIGPEAFRGGVKRYLDRHAYGSTETHDLWVALGETSSQPITDIMSAWIFQAGYPLLQVKTDGERLVLSQQPFRYLPDPSARQTWPVPVGLRIVDRHGAKSQRLLLKEENAIVSVPMGFDHVLVNEAGHGFFRVQYSAELLERLLQRLGDLSAIERFGLVNDCWALVLADRMEVRKFVELTRFFVQERDKNVWSVLVNSLHGLNRAIAEDARPALEALVRDRFGPAFADLGWNPKAGEGELTAQLRGELLRSMGTLGNDGNVQAKALDTYGAWLRNPEGVDANVAAAVVGVVAHTGDAVRYQEFRQRFRAATTPQEQQRFLFALGGFRSAELLEQTLTCTLNGEIRTQDAGLFLRSLLLGVHSRELTWGFIQANWEKLQKTLPQPGIRRMYEGITGLATAEWEREVTEFFQSTKIDLGGKILAQYLEHLHIAVRLHERVQNGWDRR